MKKFWRDHLDDVLIMGGAGLIIAATAMLSLIAAMYVAGACMVIFGILAGLGRGKENR